MHKRSREKGVNHYWNRLPDGREIDFTSDQHGGNGINKVEIHLSGLKLVGKPRTFKPIKECKSIKPALKRFLKIVEEPLRKFRKELENRARSFNA